MLDRKVPHVCGGINIYVDVLCMDYEKLSSDRLGESSASIRERVQAARDRQRVRSVCAPGEGVAIPAEVDGGVTILNITRTAPFRPCDVFRWGILWDPI